MKSKQNLRGNQCKLASVGAMCSYFSLCIRAAVFWISWRFLGDVSWSSLHFAHYALVPHHIFVQKSSGRDLLSQPQIDKTSCRLVSWLHLVARWIGLDWHSTWLRGLMPTSSSYCKKSSSVSERRLFFPSRLSTTSSAQNVSRVSGLSAIYSASYWNMILSGGRGGGGISPFALFRLWEVFPLRQKHLYLIPLEILSPLKCF